MKLKFYYIFFLLWSHSLYATTIDSLYQLLDQTSTNPQKSLTTHLLLADALRKQGKDSTALSHITIVEKQLNQRNFPIIKVHLLLTKGLLAYSQYKDEEALALFEEGYQLNKQYQAGFCVDFCINLLKVTTNLNATTYLKEGLSCAANTKDTIALQQQLGNLYTREEQYEKAIELYKNNQQLAQSIKDTFTESRAYQNIGVVYMLEGKWKQATSFYLKSAKLKEKIGDQQGLVDVQHNIARVYFNQNQYEKSLEYYQKCEAYYNNNRDTAELLDVWRNVAGVYIAQQKYEQASTLLNQILVLLPKFPNPSVALNTRLNLGNLQLKKENYPAALELFKAAFQTAQQQEDYFNLVMINNFLGEVYFSLKDSKQSVFHYQEALNTSQALGMFYEQGIALYGLYETHKYAGNTPQALNYHEQYTSIKDSLYNVETTTMLEQYDNLQKQKEIETLKAKNEKIALEKQLQARQLYFSLALIALLLTLLGLLWIYRQQQQQALQHQQKIKEMLHEQERKVLAATVKTQLQERERLGKEVHDNLGSLLATLKLQHIGGKQFWDKPDLFRESYMAMGPLIQQTADEAHRIAHEMDAGEQFAFELKPALEGLMQHIRATRQFELVFEYLGKTFKLPRKLALTIYQVTLEASANILKHAQAKNVTVRVFQRSSSVILTVEDDGRGFDTKTYQAGIGLRSMQERVSALGGNINIESTPKSGTTITATMPISSGIDI